MKVLVATLLLVSLLVLMSSTFVQLSLAVPSATPGPMPAPGFCDSTCSQRCSKAGRQDRCLKDCGICCRECNCVPSGTYGNKNECPCYRDKMSSKGTPKCP